jgi:hypothetical protein
MCGHRRDGLGSRGTRGFPTKKVARAMRRNYGENAVEAEAGLEVVGLGWEKVGYRGLELGWGLSVVDCLWGYQMQ